MVIFVIEFKFFLKTMFKNLFAKIKNKTLFIKTFMIKKKFMLK